MKLDFNYTQNKMKSNAEPASNACSHILEQLGVIIGSLLILGAMPALSAEVARIQYLMGTLCEIRALGKDKGKVNQAVNRAFEDMTKLEVILSTYRLESEASRLNRASVGSSQPTSIDLMAILRLSQLYAQQTGGSFDVTVGPLLKVWGIQKEGRIPNDQEITSTLGSVGFRYLELNEEHQTVRLLKPGMALDFGGIGKGHALDRAGEILKTSGVDCALLNFGGNILAIGTPPSKKTWIVEISDPANPSASLADLEIANASVSTSSQIERLKNAKGKRVGHIVDPRSGKPVEFEGSVTVVAPTAAQADALSTALLVMGTDLGLAFIEKQKDTAALFVIPSLEKGWEIRASSQIVRYGFRTEIPNGKKQTARSLK